MTACTSPLRIPSEMPFRISRPSTLARRFLISKSGMPVLTVPAGVVFKSSSVILVSRPTVQSDTQGIDRERGAFHPGRADGHAELIQDGLAGKVLELVDRLAHDHVGQH